MSKLLTKRQAEELHKSIIAYLDSVGLTNAANSLREESDLGTSLDDATVKRYEGLLEKKWTAVVRLQKRIMDLEAKNASLQQELETSTPLSSKSKVDPATWLPKAPARITFRGHQGPVTAVAFHPLFSILASASEDATIKLWDWDTGEGLQTLKGHTGHVEDVDFGGPKGGTLLASCSKDFTVKLWDPSKQYQCIRTLYGHDHTLHSVRFIPTDINNPSGNRLASASRDKTVRIWDVTTGSCDQVLSEHTEWVRVVTLSVDGNHLVSAGGDKMPRLWERNANNKYQLKTVFLGHGHLIECAAFAPSTAYPHLATLAGQNDIPSNPGAFFATGDREKVIKIWDSRGTIVKTLVGHDNWIRGLVFHPAGRYLLSVSDDKTIRCWDLAQEARLCKTVDDSHEFFVSCIRWAPNQQITTAPAAPETNGVGAAGKKKDDDGGGGRIRCVIATGSVDMGVRVFAA